MNNHALPRLLSPAVLDALAHSPVVVVTGARTTGKTTLVTMPPIAEGREYRSLDDYHSLDAADWAADTFVEEDAPMTIDEVQRAPRLLRAIKSISISNGYRSFSVR